MLRISMRLLKLVLPIALLAYFVLAYVEPEAFVALVEKTAFPAVIAYFTCLLAARWLQALQTRIALSSTGVEVGAVEVFRAQLVATFYTMFVPGDLVGGGVTWYLLKRARRAGAIIAMVLVYLRLVFLALAIPFVILGLVLETRMHSASLLAALAIASAATVVATLPLVFRPAARVAGKLIAAVSTCFGGRAPGIQTALATVRECIATCASASTRATCAVFALALAQHLLGAVGLWLAAEAAQANVPFQAFLWVWPLMIVVHMLPLSFGGLGVRELTLIYVLNTLYATTAESVLLLSMITLLATTVLGLAGGLWNSFLAVKPEQNAGQRSE